VNLTADGRQQQIFLPSDVCNLPSPKNMQSNLVRQNYLQAEVQTATPQKLRLLLIEAAIKNVHRTKKAWEEEKFESGFESLSLAQDIVAELLSSLDKESNPELAGKIASIYVFIFRCLSEGGMAHDPKKLDDALRVLGSERETWRLVCEKFGGSINGTANSARLDLSTDSSTKVLVAPKSPGISTATFGRPKELPPSTGSGVSWDG
jgi:flagellar protein FliS